MTWQSDNWIKTDANRRREILLPVNVEFNDNQHETSLNQRITDYSIAQKKACMHAWQYRAGMHSHTSPREQIDKGHCNCNSSTRVHNLPMIHKLIISAISYFFFLKENKARGIDSLVALTSFGTNWYVAGSLDGNSYLIISFILHVRFLSFSVAFIANDYMYIC